MGDVAAELPNSHTIIHDTITVPDVPRVPRTRIFEAYPIPTKSRSTYGHKNWHVDSSGPVH